MKKNIIVICLFISLLLLSGCGSKDVENINDKNQKPTTEQQQTQNNSYKGSTTKVKKSTSTTATTKAKKSTSTTTSATVTTTKKTTTVPTTASTTVTTTKKTTTVPTTANTTVTTTKKTTTSKKIYTFTESDANNFYSQVTAYANSKGWVNIGKSGANEELIIAAYFFTSNSEAQDNESYQEKYNKAIAHIDKSNSEKQPGTTIYYRADINKRIKGISGQVNDYSVWMYAYAE